MINNEKNSDNKNYDKNNGKKIITTNEMITNKFQEYFKNKRINVDNLKEMQLLKKKRIHIISLIKIINLK